jgi:hypothetical protein
VSQFYRPHDFSSCYSRAATLGLSPSWDTPVLGAKLPRRCLGPLLQWRKSRWINLTSTISWTYWLRGHARPRAASHPRGDLRAADAPEGRPRRATERARAHVCRVGGPRARPGNGSGRVTECRRGWPQRPGAARRAFRGRGRSSGPALFMNGARMRRTGAAAGAGGMGPLTTADSVPVTRRAVPTLGPLYRRLARREGLSRPIPPAPAAAPARPRDARS